MQDGVTELLALGRMPPESDAEVSTVERFQEGLAALVQPASDAEAVAVLDSFPAGDESFFGAAWTLLHFVETAPGWPDRAALGDRSWWVTFLRERADRGGAL